MKEKADKSDIKKEVRLLRKKTKRVEESRSQIKAKSREKGKIIKLHKDRQVELEQNRDVWKAKCKEQEKKRIEVENCYKNLAEQLQMKEEELREMLKELEGLKKKPSSQNKK